MKVSIQIHDCSDGYSVRTVSEKGVMLNENSQMLQNENDVIEYIETVSSCWKGVSLKGNAEALCGSGVLFDFTESQIFFDKMIGIPKEYFDRRPDY